MSSYLPDPILRLIFGYCHVLSMDIIGNLSIEEFDKYANIINLTKSDCLKSQMIQFMCKQNRIDIAIYLKKKFNITKSDHVNLIQCDGHGEYVIAHFYPNSDIATEFVKNFDISQNEIDGLFIWGCMDGKSEFIKWIVSNYHVTQFTIRSGFYLACYKGNLEVLILLESSFKLTKKDLNIDSAWNGYLDAAERDGHQHIVKWLNKNGLGHSCCIL